MDFLCRLFFNPTVRDTLMTEQDQSVRSKPPLFKVVYRSDQATPDDFVTTTLVNHFSYPETTSEKILSNLNLIGKSTVAVLPFEIAEQKCVEIMLDARKNNFPLQVVIEPE